MFSFLHKQTDPAEIHESIYDFKVKAIDDSIIDFSEFRGKKILIVNTASFCGFTPQYELLQKLYIKYAGKLMIVGFPSNDFMFQEPLSNSKIATFCSTKYNVTFPMAAKGPVKGDNKMPIYGWLTEARYNGLTDSTVKWNFQKYLINETGQLTHVFPHDMAPDSAEIVAAIEAASPTN